MAILREDVDILVDMLETYAETDLETLFNNRPDFIKRIRFGWNANDLRAENARLLSALRLILDETDETFANNVAFKAIQGVKL